jgi:predicted ATPase/DNA-binding SARP family transcriptional activator/tetratricopeptide (TPR) repeat protein
MPRLALRWLGAPQIELDGSPVTAERRKTVALLAYLSVSPQPQRRDHLAAFFWPDYPARKAYAYLRQSVWELSKALGSEWLEADRELIALRCNLDPWIDTARFQALLADRSTPPIDRLSEAVALYRGDFLAGFTLRDSPDFDAWQSAHTEHLRQQFSLALEQLTRVYAAQNEFDTAIATAHKWLMLDALNEAAHRELMQLYARVGQRSTALRQYELCVAALRTELGVEPDAITTALFDQIRSGAVATVARSVPATTPAASSIRQLPAQPTPFVGRESELAGIARLLAKPACRLLTLVGPGGIGKTRLALQAASDHAAAFQHGAHFVNLAVVPSIDGVIPALIDTLQLSLSGDGKTALFDYARDKQLLLVLDNFEHLIDGAALLSELSAAAPAVKIIATSREQLNLPEEWVLPIEGLTYPQDDRASALEAYSAVELFMQQAQQADAAFTLNESDKRRVGHICQLVEGMPLGVMLAASWVKTLSCAEIEHELGRDLDFLVARSRQLPERHRSLRAVFMHSWQRLSEAERVAFQQLAVFQGGFRAEAAAQIVGASLHVLAQLVDKSLVRRDTSGRYDLHEVLRQYATEKLTASPAEADRVRAWHGAYYLNLLCEMEIDLKGRDQLGALNFLRAESENLRAAWQWAIDHCQINLLLRATPLLVRLDIWAGCIRSLDELLRSALAEVRRWPANDQDVAAFTAVLIVHVMIHDTDALARTLERTPQLAHDCLTLARSLPDDLSKAEVLTHLLWTIANDDPAAAQALYHEGRAIRVEAGAQWEVAEIDLIWANVCGWHDPAQAQQLYQASLDHFTTCGDRISAGDCLGGLARLHDQAGNTVEAARLWRERLAIAQERSDQWTELMMWAVLGRQATRLGHYDEAKYDHHQSLSIVQNLGHLRMTADQLNDLALAEVLSGDLDQAAQHLKQSLQLLARVEDPTGFVETYGILSDLAAARGEWAQAAQHAQAALDQAEALPPDDYTRPTCRAVALTRLGEAAIALGDYAAAREYLRAAVELIPQIPPQWQSDAMRTLTAVARFVLSEQPLTAIELLAFVNAQSVTPYQLRVETQRLLNDLTDRLPSDEVTAARQRGAAATLADSLSVSTPWLMSHAA